MHSWCLANGPVEQGPDNRLGGRIAAQLVQVLLDDGRRVVFGHSDSPWYCLARPVRSCRRGCPATLSHRSRGGWTASGLAVRGGVNRGNGDQAVRGGGEG